MTQTFGTAALIHRCHVHKLRNVLEHLPEGQRPWVRALSSHAPTNAPTSPRLDGSCRIWPAGWGPLPECGGECPEGLEETLTVSPPDCLIASGSRSRRPTQSGSDQSHATCEAERQTVAWWPDDPALDGGRHPRSRERISTTEGPQGHAEARRRASRSRSAARHRCFSAERRVECHSSRR